ncbi:MAG: hypothetical protein LBL42_03020, partial [Tannerella sp.]|nr:hypothetical protein [Tannerella sp.]
MNNAGIYPGGRENASSFLNSGGVTRLPECSVRVTPDGVRREAHRHHRDKSQSWSEDFYFLNSLTLLIVFRSKQVKNTHKLMLKNLKYLSS